MIDQASVENMFTVGKTILDQLTMLCHSYTNACMMVREQMLTLDWFALDQPYQLADNWLKAISKSH